MRFRYQVFRQSKNNQPVFTAQWYWLANHYADSFSLTLHIEPIPETRMTEVMG